MMATPTESKSIVFLDEVEDDSLNSTIDQLSLHPTYSWNTMIVSLLENINRNSIKQDLEYYIQSLKSLITQIKELTEWQHLNTNIDSHLLLIKMKLYEQNINLIAPIARLLEDLLATCGTVELKIIAILYENKDTELKDNTKKLSTQSKQILSKIRYAFYWTDKNVVHCLLKMKFNRKSSACVHVVKNLYHHMLLINKIKNFDDLSLCAYYLLFCKYKRYLPHPEQKPTLELWLGRFNKNVRYLNELFVLQEILRWDYSLVTADCNSEKERLHLVHNYFKYIKDKEKLDCLQTNLDKRVSVINEESDKILQRISPEFKFQTSQSNLVTFNSSHDDENTEEGYVHQSNNLKSEENNVNSEDAYVIIKDNDAETGYESSSDERIQYMESVESDKNFKQDEKKIFIESENSNVTEVEHFDAETFNFNLLTEVKLVPSETEVVETETKLVETEIDSVKTETTTFSTDTTESENNSMDSEKLLIDDTTSSFLIVNETCHPTEENPCASEVAEVKLENQDVNNADEQETIVCYDSIEVDNENMVIDSEINTKEEVIEESYDLTENQVLLEDPDVYNAESSDSTNIYKLQLSVGGYEEVNDDCSPDVDATTNCNVHCDDGVVVTDNSDSNIVLEESQSGELDQNVYEENSCEEENVCEDQGENQAEESLENNIVNKTSLINQLQEYITIPKPEKIPLNLTTGCEQSYYKEEYSQESIEPYNTQDEPRNLSLDCNVLEQFVQIPETMYDYTQSEKLLTRRCKSRGINSDVYDDTSNYLFEFGYETPPKDGCCEQDFMAQQVNIEADISQNGLLTPENETVCHMLPDSYETNISQIHEGFVSENCVEYSGDVRDLKRYDECGFYPAPLSSAVVPGISTLMNDYVNNEESLDLSCKSRRNSMQNSEDLRVQNAITFNEGVKVQKYKCNAELMKQLTLPSLEDDLLKIPMVPDKRTSQKSKKQRISLLDMDIETAFANLNSKPNNKTVLQPRRTSVNHCNIPITDPKILKTKPAVVMSPFRPSDVSLDNRIEQHPVPEIKIEPEKNAEFVNKNNYTDEDLNLLVQAAESGKETRLPFKKRRMTVPEEATTEISYPATPMVSIAELEAVPPNNGFLPMPVPNSRTYLSEMPVETTPVDVEINYNLNAYPYSYVPCATTYFEMNSLLPVQYCIDPVDSKENLDMNLHYFRSESIEP